MLAFFFSIRLSSGERPDQGKPKPTPGPEETVPPATSPMATDLVDWKTWAIEPSEAQSSKKKQIQSAFVNGEESHRFDDSKKDEKTERLSDLVDWQTSAIEPSEAQSSTKKQIQSAIEPSEAQCSTKKQIQSAFVNGEESHRFDDSKEDV
jgi:hypothetical protein